MILKILLPIIVTALAPSAFADTEFEDSVPIDLVKALVGNTPYGESRIFSDLASSFPRLDIPNDLELMGSIERSFGVAAVYRTELSVNRTEAVLHDAFLQAEYIEFELPSLASSENGFVSALANAPFRYKRYCHDSFGFLTSTFNSSAQNAVVTLSSTPSNDNRSCADQLAEQQLQLGRRAGAQSGLQQYLPRMELPVTDVRRSGPYFGLGGLSGSSNSIEVKANVNVDLSIDALFEHFAGQIVTQGWVLDTRNMGTSSAIGNWTRSPEPDTELIGTLTILKTGDESFELKFQLTSTGANNNSGQQFFRGI